MSRLKEVLKLAPAPTEVELLDRQRLAVSSLFDVDEMNRIILYRRAARAGFYSEGGPGNPDMVIDFEASW